MTEAQKIQKELDAMNAQRESVKSENTVECGGPVVKRSFTYKPNGQL